MEVNDAFELDYDSEKVENVEDDDKNPDEELVQVVTATFKLSLDSFLIVVH